MGNIQETEKQARNLLIRKFNELTGIHSLDEALAHLNDNQVNKAVDTLYKAHPEDHVLARRVKTMRMSQILNEIKEELTASEKDELLMSLRLESYELENQIVYTQQEIAKRLTDKEAINETFSLISQANSFEQALTHAKPDFLDAMEHLYQSDPKRYQKEQQYFFQLRELITFQDKVLDKNKDLLLKAIKSFEPEELKSALNLAKTAIDYQEKLKKIISHYNIDQYFSKQFIKEQAHTINTSMSLFRPGIKEPNKIGQITLIDFLAQQIAQDRHLSLDEKGGTLYAIFAITQEDAKKQQINPLVNLLEKEIKQFEEDTDLEKIDLLTLSASDRLTAFCTRIDTYLEGQKVNQKEQVLLDKIFDHTRVGDEGQ